MEVKIERLTEIELALDAMKTTSGLLARKNKLNVWKSLLVSAGGVPHSPLRAMRYRIKVEGIPYWVAMHYRTHHVGLDIYIQSQRSKENRDEEIQGALVNMILDINANALINIGKARTCFKASFETRQVVQSIRKVLFEGDEYDQYLAQVICPPCEWYQKCFEPKPCKK